MSVRRQRGFTLLEVLLAGFILFITIAAMTMVYRGAILTSSKAEASLRMSAALPFIRPVVTDQIRAKAEPDGRFGAGQYGTVNYSWTAIVSHRGRPSLEILEVNGADDVYEYLLWNVQLTLSLNNRVEKYIFQEMTW
jgi:type II secretory pathway pseudopilin PulG|tara:strand:- start:1082 stop:1492 length:411 start_codon:yes stop_codon:yes gene_type:complete